MNWLYLAFPISISLRRREITFVLFELCQNRLAGYSAYQEKEEEGGVDAWRASQ